MTSSWLVYVLALADGRFYVGMTQRLEARVAEHNAGGGPMATRDHRPVRLLWSETCSDTATARRLERWLKRRSRAEKLVYMAAHGTHHAPPPEQ